ncbi:MAG: VOC family protein [Ilumatobacteraceae bacterium]
MTALESPAEDVVAIADTPQPVVRTTGFHHVAYACRDIEATHHFYEELMGFTLIHTEVVPMKDGGLFRHIFYDTGDGACIAFFDVHGIGEQEGWRADISTGNGLPVWINHIAFGATEETQRAAKARMTAAGIEPLMEVDHGWCHSLYYLDPNGIMVEFCRDTPGVVPNPTEARSLFTATEQHSGDKKSL